MQKLDDRSLWKRRRFKMYSIYAWGLPLVIVVSGHVVDNLDVLKVSYIWRTSGKCCV